MAQQYIVDLGINDTLQDVIRKCNRNFRQVSSAWARRQQSSDQAANAGINAAMDAISDEVGERQESDSALSQRISDLEDELGSVATRILAAHPVGSLYMSTASANPSGFIGGTWQKLEDVFLVAAGSMFPAGQNGTVQVEQGSDSTVPWLSVYVWKRVS